MSTRLTQTYRGYILQRAMADIFTGRVEALIKETQSFSRDYYDSHFKREAEKIKGLNLTMDWTPKRKFSLSFCLNDDEKFRLWSKDTSYSRTARIERETMSKLHTVKGLDAYYGAKIFTLGTTKVCPTEADGPILVKGGWKTRLASIQKRGLKMVAEEQKLHDELKAFLLSCKTYKQVEDNWPEGKKYLPLKEPKKNLPIPLVDNVREAMRKAG